MRIKNILFVFLLVNMKQSLVFAQQYQISETAQISLLTIEHGNDPYNIFGHSAIRVFDPRLNIDEVYNYGTFDFKTDNFTLKFLRGKLDYQLAIQPYAQFLRGYQYEKRAIVEQVLNLDAKSKADIYSFIRTNYEPENRLYLYDFFFDNCSTRIRDLFETELNGYSIQAQSIRTVTYRQLLDEYLQGLDWTDFGIDLIIGSVADANADHRQQMFLPDYLHDWTDKMAYENTDSQSVQLVKSEATVLPLDTIQHKSYWITPVILFSFLAFIELLLFLFANKGSKRSGLLRFYDLLMYGILCLVSIVVAMMWFGTNHQACGDNYNLIWANPLFLLVFVSYFWNNPGQKALFLSSVFLVLTLLLWTILPQQFHVAVIPIIVLYLFKNLRLLRHANFRFSQV